MVFSSSASKIRYVQRGMIPESGSNFDLDGPNIV